eukprot:CAMPEP_0195144184 /NCGR_PEP_ID=MMETSP0448-20130528/167625_1 /TAXON_ID=66468 /ORGANISM="Heterocapsa triquestra, Strain CCMP 448" /LENGTH=97 /DNA_ID=CAMNT_0040182645 /DNA_START=586 /DNA_END=882 /DNA_ORIENTATION=-
MVTATGGSTTNEHHRRTVARATELAEHGLYEIPDLSASAAGTETSAWGWTGYLQAVGIYGMRLVKCTVEQHARRADPGMALDVAQQGIPVLPRHAVT